MDDVPRRPAPPTVYPRAIKPEVAEHYNAARAAVDAYADAVEVCLDAWQRDPQWAGPVGVTVDRTPREPDPGRVFTVDRYVHDETGQQLDGFQTYPWFWGFIVDEPDREAQIKRISWVSSLGDAGPIHESSTLAYIAMWRRVARGGTPSYMAVGAKWTIPSPRVYLEWVQAHLGGVGPKRDLTRLLGLMRSVLVRGTTPQGWSNLLQRYERRPDELVPHEIRICMERALEAATEAGEAAGCGRSCIDPRIGTDESAFVIKWRKHGEPITFTEAFLWISEIKGRDPKSTMWRNHNPTGSWLKRYGRKTGRPGDKSPWELRAKKRGG